MTTTTDCACALTVLPHRCRYHGKMMRTLYEVYYSQDHHLSWLIYNQSDGYGEVGYVPSQGHDWSGIRDSSAEAVERMYLIAKNGPWADA